MSICQVPSCGKKTTILLGNRKLGIWVCEKCDYLIEKGKITKTNLATYDTRGNKKGQRSTP